MKKIVITISLNLKTLKFYSGLKNHFIESVPFFNIAP